MSSLFFRCLAVNACLLLLPFGVACALEPGESIVLDPVSGNYKLTYSDERDDGSKTMSHATFVPATKIVPTIDSKFQLIPTGAVMFSYSVGNGVQSRQVLDSVRIDIVGKVTGSQDLPTDLQTVTQAQAYAVLEANSHTVFTPAGWRGAISAYENGALIKWDPIDSASSIQPKGHLSGFGFSSQSLPGLGIAQFKGARRFANGFGGSGPHPDSDIRKQYDALKKNDYVTRNVVAPIIAIPSPFDAAVLLDSIRAHISTWTEKQLLDPAFATQLDRSLIAATNAYRGNQPKAGREHIETLRRLLEREHRFLDHDDEDNDDTPEHKVATRLTIDRLAARVLDFDLRYVLKRMEHEHDREEGDRRKER